MNHFYTDHHGTLAVLMTIATLQNWLSLSRNSMDQSSCVVTSTCHISTGTRVVLLQVYSSK